MKRQLLVLTLMMFGILFAEWTIVETYPIPENTSGLAWDGEYLYCGTYLADIDGVYRIDPADGSCTLIFNGTMGDTYDLTWDGANLWAIGHAGGVNTPARACKLDMQGNILAQLTMPVHDMSGIVWDDGHFWVAAYDDPDGYIYKIDDQGNILDGYDAPYYQPWSLCMEGEYLWMVDNWSNEIFKIDPADGSVLETYIFEMEDPAGIVFDGTYFWYCDDGVGNDNCLHKVDPNGEGFANIELGWEEHDFGEVVIGTPETVTLPISSNGTCDLVISDWTVSNDAFSISVDIPIVITHGTTFDLEITCDPEHIGSTTATMDIVSNAPNHPAETVSLRTFAMDAQPRIVVQPDVIHFGTVRLGSLTGRSMWIKNMGVQDLSLSGISFDLSMFDEFELEFPVVISPYDSVVARVWLDANEPVDIETAMTIESNDPDESSLTIPINAYIDTGSHEIGTEYWHFQTADPVREISTIKRFIDINDDGFEEVIVCDQYGQVYCLNGNSSGDADILWRFRGSISTVFPFTDRSIIIADDLDGDNVQDVVVGSTGPNGSIYALKGLNGQVIWQYDTDVVGGARTNQIDGKRDFTGDGVCDILATTSYFFSATILLNGATGDVEWIREFNRGQKRVCSIADQNGDGVPDVYSAENGSMYNRLSLLSGASGWVLFALESTYPSYEDLIDIQDVNGDNIQDLAYVKTTRTHTCLNFDQEILWEVTPDAYAIRYKRAFDGATEYIVPTMSGTDAWLTINSATGDAGAVYPGSIRFLDCTPVHELNGDRHFDILCGTESQAMALSGSDASVIWSMNVDDPVNQACPIGDLDGNNSQEMLFGDQGGLVVCRSGGENASMPWGTLTLDVSANSGFSVVIAEYSLTGEESFSGTIPEDGVLVLPDVSYGTYSLEVSLMLHHSFVLENFEFSSDMTIPVFLQEVLYPVHDFYAETYFNRVTLYWGSMPTRNSKSKKETKTGRYFQGVRLYIDDIMIADMVEGHDYEVGYVSPGTHVFSAVNVYTTGVSEPVEIEVSVVHNDDPGIKPYETALLGNTPNPFNPSTAIRFSLREDMPVTLAIYNIRGQKVRTLIDERMERGEHTAQWLGDDDSGKPCSSGVYLYRMQTACKTETKKMIMMK